MDRTAFGSGVRDALPVVFGIVPFGLVAGVAAVDAGFSLPQAVGLSVFVFAGAAQLATLSLVERGAPFVAVVATALAINLRMGLYSATIAPHFREYATRWRALLSYLLIDEAFALALTAYRERDVDPRWYYLGAAGALWATWQVTTVLGVLLGTGVPDAWGLEFAVPLVFLGLLVPAIRSAPHLLAAVAAAAVAVYGAGWPFNLGLLVGTAVGVIAGLLAEAVRR
ncbi:MAG: AzlC family ABC transporter permease [Halarchaeum sp.]